MPKVISYTPAWLSRPTPGFQLFNTNNPSSKSNSLQHRDATQQKTKVNGENNHVGANRRIARRGTEIFVVVGRQIRWADLPTLKDDWELKEETPSKTPSSISNGVSKKIIDEEPEDGSYRVLKVSVGEDIQQLSVSPNGKLLAIVTAHSAQIAILPDSSHLNVGETKPIKPRTYIIGPTTHVLSQSSIASVLWHPLGESGSCLVTTTTDAVVRLWEFDRENRWSSDSPALAIDLKKLVVATSEEEDLSPNRVGRNKIFTSDAVGMEIASACFGGTGSDNESPWSSMTLWFAMKGGDLYALCPLLPSKWQPPSTLLPSLSTAVVAKAAFLQGEGVVSDSARQYDNQYTWVQELDSQEPILAQSERESSSEIEVYKRPKELGPIPRLQGPFQVFSEDSEEEIELTDIHIIAAKSDAGSLMREDDDSDAESEYDDEAGLSVSIVCLITTIGRVFVCLDLDGVEGQWLPKKKPKDAVPPPPDPYLVVLEGLDTLKLEDVHDAEWPSFTPDVQSRYSFFTTNSNGIFFFSFEPWLQTLEEEFVNSNPAGTSFRVDIFKNGPGTLRERILSFDEDPNPSSEISIPACLAMQDSDLGYFVLTSINGQPQAATLDKPYLDPVPALDLDDNNDYIPDLNNLTIGPARSAYQPPQAFYARSTLIERLESHIPVRHKGLTHNEIRLSTATLDVMTQAHRVLSQETHQLGIAAADLFRRCERLQEEMRDQIRRTNAVADRTEKLTGTDDDFHADDTADSFLAKGGNAAIEERLEQAREKHEMLVRRHEALRRKVASELHGKALSDREKKWVREADKLKEAIEGKEDEAGAEDRDEEQEDQTREPWQRYEEVQDLKDDLVPRAKAIQHDSRPSSRDTDHIPQDLRRDKIAQVMKLLHRESLLVEAAQARLERLNGSAVGVSSW